MKCPKCGSKAVGTNVGKRVLATTVGFVASLPLALIRQNGPAKTLGVKVNREICPYSEYICSECGHKFKVYR